MKILTYHAIRDISQREDYLRRWSLRLPFGLSLKLHQILRPDLDRCEHDHPWWFLRLILWGGYVEQSGGRMVVRRPWRLSWCPPHFRHRIVTLTSRTSWSLVLCGRNTEVWGFYTRDGWMFWRDFVKRARSTRVLWCEDGTRPQ